VVYTELGRYQEEVEAYKQAIRLKPDDADAHYNLGLAYLGLDDKGSALEEDKILKGIDSEMANGLFNSSWNNQHTYMGPYYNDAYGPDATGRPFQWKTRDGQTVPPGSKVEPNVYGLGVGKDKYGRPVKTEPWP
jgi:tetratricopeptide (TPR) repeat protein